jgi:hypothetical protein
MYVMRVACKVLDAIATLEIEARRSPEPAPLKRIRKKTFLGYDRKSIINK